MSLDDIDTTQEDRVPILCEFCQSEHFHSKLLGFVFGGDDLVECPKCGKEGCPHWCDGKTPCEWCVHGEPTNG